MSENRTTVSRGTSAKISAPESEKTAEPESHTGLAARQIAFGLLDNVLNKNQPLDQSLERDDGFAALPLRDRGFVRMLVATTLRRLGQVDDMIRRATDRSNPLSPPALQTLLRMGMTQIAFMDVADHAAVDTTVQMADSLHLSRQKGLVNAALRRATRDAKDWIAKQDEGRLNTPKWLMKLWIEDYGLRPAAEIAQANLAEAALDITLKDAGEQQYWADTLGASVLPTGSLRRAAGGNVQDLPSYDDGMWWVQDAAAALPAHLFGRELQGETVLDICAAPGGKTAQLAAQGAHVIAVDRSVKRLKRLEENMKRLRLEGQIMTEAADAAVWQPREKAQFVLLDAPCTATGTVRRHPDVLWLKQPQDMESLMATQARILDNAVEMLAPNGVLLYCTCSLQKAEGEQQIERLLAAQGGKIARAPFAPEEIGNVSGILNPEGDLRILPSHLTAHGGMDGFYIARLVKL